MEQTTLHGDNQQVSLEAKKGWMGGIMDGEGTIMMARHAQANTYFPRLQMGNTNYFICKQFVEILREFEIPFHVFYEKSKNSKHKSVWRITIHGFKRVKKFLDIFTPYLFGKKEQSKLILDYINERLSLPNKGYYNTPISENLKQIAEKVIMLNKTGFQKTSTTIRQTQPIEL